MSARDLALLGLSRIPAINPEDDLIAILATALNLAGLELLDYDVLVITQKIVSKAEDRYLHLRSVQPDAQAIAIADETAKAPQMVQAVLDESVRIVRKRKGLLITKHRLGMVMANGGIDQSNLGRSESSAQLLRLPLNADTAAEHLRAGLARIWPRHFAVLISDSAGRAWRRGLIGLCIGAAGLPSLLDLRGEIDRDGITLKTTMTGFADQIACAAGLVMGEAAEGIPAVLVRGLTWTAPAVPASALVRPPAEDLFP